MFNINLGSKLFDGRALVLTLGTLFGLMPVTAYAAPILLSVLVLLFGSRQVDRRAAWSGLAVIQYCAVQYFYLQYHGSMPLWDFDLIKVYFVLSLISVPFAAVILSKSFEFEKFEDGYFLGLLVSAGILAYQYFVQNQCRAVGFTFNPLVPPFVLIPLLSYVLARRVSEGRSSVLDVVSIILGIMIAGLFPGGRMGLYSISLIVFVIGLFTIVKLDWRRSVLVWGALAFGLFTTIAIDGNRRCSFLGRISAQFSIVNDLSESLSSLSTAALVEPKEAMGILADEMIESKLGNVTAPVNLELEDPVSDPSDVAMEVMHRSESSSAWRWFMWTNAVSRIAAYRVEWLTGIGWVNEASVVNRGFNMSYKHAHNQILSWLLWGGLPSLLSAALLFGVLPLRAFKQFPSAVFVLASGLGFFTNSLMLSGQAVSGFVLSVLLVLTVEWRARE